MIQKLKKEADGGHSFSIPVKKGDEVIGWLRPVTEQTLANKDFVARMADWRRNNREFFTTQFQVTPEGTEKWLKEKILASSQSILFIVEGDGGCPIGHVGLCEIDFQKKTCLFDNILRGEPNRFKGGMFYACLTLLNWCFHTLGMETVSLKVLADNERAIRLYEKLGFQPAKTFPLRKRTENGIIKWVPVEKEDSHPAERYLLIMNVSRNGTQNQMGDFQ